MNSAKTQRDADTDSSRPDLRVDCVGEAEGGVVAKMKRVRGR
jgi:hypothetical protein